MRVLIVVAHPDDEVLGCGGTIVKHLNKGDEVHLMIMSDGVFSRDTASQDEMDRRNSSAKRAHKILGIENVAQLSFSDNRMDAIPLLDIVRPIEEFIKIVEPAIVYTHHYGDLNVDHRITHQAVMIACRPQPSCSVKEIYGFEVLSSTEWSAPSKDPFLPSVFVDVSEEAKIKLDAILAYSEEMRATPHSRSSEHVQLLLKHRGYCVGVEAAEAFVAYRIIR